MLVPHFVACEELRILRGFNEGINHSITFLQLNAVFPIHADGRRGVGIYFRLSVYLSVFYARYLKTDEAWITELDVEMFFNVSPGNTFILRS